MHTCHPIFIVPLIQLFRLLFKNVFLHCCQIQRLWPPKTFDSSHSIGAIISAFSFKMRKNCPIYSNLCMCDCCIRRCVQTCNLSPLEPKSLPHSLQKMLAESIGEPVWRQNMSEGASCLSWIFPFAFWSSGHRARCAGDAVVSLVWGFMLWFCYLLMVYMVWVILLVCIWNKKRFRELCLSLCCIFNNSNAAKLNCW